MTAIVLAKGLAGDRSYAIQVRPIFNDGTFGDWGPTFSIIQRAITPAPVMTGLLTSPSGIRISWLGTLNASFDEQWLVKKFDSQTAADNFDSSGIEIYRGNSTTTIDWDLKQEPVAFFAVVKIDRYGNRSDPSVQGLSFPVPDPPQNTTLENITGGFIVHFESQPTSPANKYHVVRVKYGSPFESFKILTRARSAGTKCTLTISGGTVNRGDVVQISMGDSRWDGIFMITEASGTTISYIHTTTTSDIPSETASGWVLPTSSGVSEEGIEVHRIEITSSSVTNMSATYIPTIAGQKVYVAVGTEDAYKNRSSWSITDQYSHVLIYGRNYIAERDNITSLVTTNNRYRNGYWKYGYIGWKGVHSTSTLDLTAPGTAGTLAIGSIDATPDRVRLGVDNGSSTALSFASGYGTNSQSRTYPSLINETPGGTGMLSKPLVDDSYYVPETGDFKSISDIWYDLYPTGRGLVWLECSATDVFDDSVDTRNPISLDGTTNLTGSFTIIPESWGTNNDNPSAMLKLYAVAGDWDQDRAGGIYDPHYSPLWESKDYSRSVTKSYNITNKAKSSNTCTITIESSISVYPVAGDLVTISLNDTDFDGTWVVATASGTTFTYATITAANITSVAATGTALINPGQSYAVTNKARTGTSGNYTITLKIGGTGAMPAAGEYVDVGIGNTSIDGQNLLISSVDLVNRNIVITDTRTTGSTVTSSASGGYVFKKSVINEPYISLIDQWVISKNPDLSQLYTEKDGSGNQTALSRTCYWNWNAPASQNIHTVRLVWVLDYLYNDFATANSSGTSSWVAGSDYIINLSDFQAWPGVNPYASIGNQNEFAETQIFNNGAQVTGDLSIDGDLSLTGDLTTGGDNVVYGDIYGNALTLTGGDLNILNGKGFVGGNTIFNGGNVYIYTYDYPNSATAKIADVTNTANTVNSIRVQNLPNIDTNRFLTMCTWSGRFINGDGAATYVFKMYRAIPTAATGSKWIKVREISSRGPEPSGSMTHIYHDSVANTDGKPAYAVTITNVTNTTGVNNIQNTDTQDANKMAIVLFPLNNMPGSTYKPAALLGGSEIVPGYTSVNLNDGSGVDTTGMKTATFTFSAGWKGSYKQAGGLNNYPSGDLVQGYYSSNNGNQRSAWGFGTDKWVKTAGTLPAGTPTDFKIVSCTMTMKATDWYSRHGGTAIVGTHKDGTASKIGNYFNIFGRTPDRKRVSYSGTGIKTFDLGLTIGAEIWNGHAKDNLPVGSVAGAAIADKDNARGIILGPGPSTASQYYGAFSPTSLKITLNVQWKE